MPIVGTPPEAIHLAEERGAFGRVLAEAGLPAPKHGTARSFDEAQGDRRTRSATRCWSGRRTCSAAAAWRSSTTTTTLGGYIDRATEVSPEHPVLVDRFLDDAIEIDVDALYDGTELFLGGVMEHIEEAGIHSGDSACALPPITLGGADIARIREATEAIAARGRGARAAQHAVRAGRRRALRPRGQPARQPHRAVRRQGDRGAAGQGRRAGDARRDDRRSCAPRACCPPRRRRGPAARRRRSASRRRCCRGTGSEAASTPCSARR